MSQEENPTSVATVLMSFLAGAAVGAVVAALITPKTGPEVRDDLMNAAARARRKATDLAKDASVVMDDLMERGRLAAADFRRGITDSVTHLKQPARPRRGESAGPNGVLAGLGGWEGHDGG
jgi:gas vesicle protein